MLFNIPQFIDIEDKIVGPLTAKQLGWLAAGGVLMLIAWTMLTFPAFVGSAIFIVIVFGGLAFYRPNGQPLTALLGAMFVFFFKPKIYMWKRLPETKKLAKIIKKTAPTHTNKEVTLEEIAKVSQLLEIRKK
jgi:hypothetical protein